MEGFVVLACKLMFDAMRWLPARGSAETSTALGLVTKGNLFAEPLPVIQNHFRGAPFGSRDAGSLQFLCIASIERVLRVSVLNTDSNEKAPPSVKFIIAVSVTRIPADTRLAPGHMTFSKESQN